MKKTIFLLCLGSFIAITCSFAGNLPDPPPLGVDVGTQHYLKKVADNWNNLEVVITNPDGSRRGNYGDMIILLTGGSYYLEVCTSSPNGTVWKGVVLTDTP